MFACASRNRCKASFGSSSLSELTALLLALCILLLSSLLLLFRQHGVVSNVTRLRNVDLGLHSGCPCPTGYDSLSSCRTHHEQLQHIGVHFPLGHPFAQGDHNTLVYAFLRGIPSLKETGNNWKGWKFRIFREESSCGQSRAHQVPLSFPVPTLSTIHLANSRLYPLATATQQGERRGRQAAGAAAEVGIKLAKILWDAHTGSPCTLCQECCQAS